MVTLKSLAAQIKKKEMQIEMAQKKDQLELDKVKLQKKLKILSRSTSTKRNVIFASRIGRGLKVLGKKTGSALVKQARLIKEQDEREAAAARRVGKRISKRAKKGGKRLQKESSMLFGGLDF